MANYGNSIGLPWTRHTCRKYLVIPLHAMWYSFKAFLFMICYSERPASLGFAMLLRLKSLGFDTLWPSTHRLKRPSSLIYAIFINSDETSKQALNMKRAIKRENATYIVMRCNASHYMSISLLCWYRGCYFVAISPLYYTPPMLLLMMVNGAGEWGTSKVMQMSLLRDVRATIWRRGGSIREVGGYYLLLSRHWLWKIG